MTKELISLKFPMASELQINSAIKYQEKFSLTLENLKCLNPDCNKMSVWNNTKSGFAYCCSKECKLVCETSILQLKKDKMKKTFLSNYGVDNPSKHPKVRKKLEDTCLIKYGVKSIFCLEETKQKIKMTYFKKTGYPHPRLNPLSILKYKNTCFLKFGVDNPTKSLKIINFKRTNHNLIYGVNNPMQKHITNFNNWDDIKFWENNFILIDGTFNLKLCMEYFNCNESSAHKKIKEFEIEYNKRSGFSFQEKEVCNFIKDLNINTVENKRLSEINELDIYIPDHNLAIEYNGIYWHSYMHPDRASSDKQTDIRYCKQRHIRKTEACQAQGIKLLHIFENEWSNPVKQEIWKSVISNALGKSIKLGARKCILKPVPKKDVRPFLEENHLQGYGVSPIAYGLYYEDTLMSITTFASGKGRMDKNTDWELIRFCNRKGYNVQGAASRLLKAFRSEHKGSIKSYANRRWSDGNLYRALGFKEIGISAPNHFYWHKSDSSELIVRQQLQKHKLKDKIENFDSSLTAFQNVTNAGYNIIWDSGNYVFLLPEEES